MDIPFLGEVFTIYIDPCQTFRWCGELSNSVTIKKSKVTMACSATVKNDYKMMIAMSDRFHFIFLIQQMESWDFHCLA